MLRQKVDLLPRLPCVMILVQLRPAPAGECPRAPDQRIPSDSAGGFSSFNKALRFMLLVSYPNSHLLDVILYQPVSLNQAAAHYSGLHADVRETE